MALSLGKLSVIIGADTQQLQDGVARSRRELRALGRSMRRGVNQAGMYTAAIAGVGAAMGTHLVRTSLRAQRNLRNLREETGINLRTLQGLQEVAVRYGIEQDSVNDAVRDFAERMGEARTAGGEMKEGFEILEQASGVQIDLTKDVNTVLDQYIKAMANTNDAQTRSAVSAMVMSDAGREMAPVFHQGAQAIQQAAQRAREMGSALDTVDMQMVAQAQVALSRLERVVDAVANRLTVALAPVLTTIANRMETAARNASGFRDTIINAMQQTHKAIVVAKSAVVALKVAWKGVLVVGHSVVAGWAGLFAQLMKWSRQGSNAIIDQINKVIEAMRGLPFAEGLEKLPRATKSALEEGVAGTAESAQRSIDRLTSEMHTLVMEADTLDDVRQQWDDIRDSVRKAAEQAASNQTKAVAAPSVSQDERGRFIPEAERRKQLDEFRKSLMTKLEAEQAHHAQRMEKLRGWREQELLMEREFNNLKRKEEQRHTEKIAQIRKAGLSQVEKFNRKSWAGQAQTMASHLVQMTNTVAGQSKEMFQINKSAAIAEASVEAIKGAEKTWNAYPYPWNIPMTAAHVASSVARISKLKSQSFSGGGSTAPSVAGGTQSGATPTSPQGGGGDGGGGNVVNPTFNIQGDSLSKKAFRELMDGLSETLKDGGRLGDVTVQ